MESRNKLKQGPLPYPAGQWLKYILKHENYMTSD
jgi:hypothetical protein